MLTKSLKFQRILLIDDDLEDQTIFEKSMSLVYPSVQIEMKLAGDETLVHLLTTTVLPDIIFMDIRMPGRSGTEFLNEIKKVGRLRNIPVVIYTTSNNQTDVVETFRLGAAYFLSKPSSFAELKAALTHVLTNDPPQGDDRTLENFVIPRKN